MKRWSLCLVLVTLFMVLGCGRDYDQTNVQTNVSATSYLLNAEDFDLETIMTLISENKVKDAEDLQNQINNPESGLTNVDADKDGNRDFILVKEVQAEQKVLSFLAIPSSTGKEEDAVNVAEVKFSRTGDSNQVQLSGSYPNYVNGYHDHYYHHGMSVGDALFLSWVLSPSRPYYYRPYASYYAPSYRPMPVYGASMMSTKRTTYRSTQNVTTVAPMKRQAIGSDYGMASKTQSKYSKGKGDVYGDALGNRAGSVKSFQTRPADKPKPTGSSFGGGSNSSPKPTPVAKPTPTYKPSTPSSNWGSATKASAPSSSGSSYKPSKPSSSGWGSSSGRSSSSGSRSSGSGSRRR